MPNRQHLVFRVTSSMLMAKPRHSSLQNLVTRGDYSVPTPKQNKHFPQQITLENWTFRVWSVLIQAAQGHDVVCMSTKRQCHTSGDVQGKSWQQYPHVSSFPPSASVSIPCMQISIWTISKKKCWGSATFATTRWDLNAWGTGRHCNRNHLFWSPAMSLSSLEEFHSGWEFTLLGEKTCQSP